MKKIITLSIFLNVYFVAANAQIIEIVKSVITAGGATNTQGMLKANAGISYPLGIQNVITQGSEVIIPPLTMGIEYGLFKNVTIGALGGYCKTKSPELSWQKITNSQQFSSILSQAQEELCNTFPAIAASNGIDCSKKNTSTKEEGKTTYALEYLMAGVKAEFYFKGGSDKLLFSLGTQGGYKFITKRPTGTEKPENADWASTIAGEVASKIETVSNIFYVADIGVHYQASSHWGAYVRGGYGYGYGDNIALGAKSIILSAGASYLISPPKAQRDAAPKPVNP